MSEKPSLDTIKKIASGDKEFEEKLLSIIKRELPQEIMQFNQNFNASNFMMAAENVHKLNHKIIIFGLEQGSEIAYKFENELRAGNGQLKSQFLGILDKITLSLNTF